MEMKGTLRAEDVLAAQWLHVKPRPFYAIVGVLLLMLAASVLWFSFSIPALRANGWLLAVPIALLAGSAMWVPYRSVRSYRQRKNMQRELRIATSDRGLLGESETGHINAPWTDYLKWKEGDKVFLLYIADDAFQIIPKRFFQSETDVGLFRELLKAKIGHVAR